jgi:hypothetical protein
MPTKTYARKNKDGGGYGNPQEGSPSFTDEISAALPGRTWIVVADGPNVDVIVDGADLTAQEDTDLDAAHANWDPDDIAVYQQKVIAQIDVETGVRIAAGFEYPAASGKFFSMSQNAQINWLGLGMSADALTYPYTIRTKDDTDAYAIVDTADAAGVYAAAFTLKESTLAQGRGVKTAVLAEGTVAGVDAAAASWLSGGPP